MWDRDNASVSMQYDWSEVSRHEWNSWFQKPAASRSASCASTLLQATLHFAAAWDFFPKQTRTMSLPCLEIQHGASLPSGKAATARTGRIGPLGLQPLGCSLSHNTLYSGIRAPAVHHVGLFTSCLCAFASAVPSAGKALTFFSVSHLFFKRAKCHHLCEALLDSS